MLEVWGLMGRFGVDIAVSVHIPSSFYCQAKKSGPGASKYQPVMAACGPHPRPCCPPMGPHTTQSYQVAILWYVPAVWCRFIPNCNQTDRKLIPN